MDYICSYGHFDIYKDNGIYYVCTSCPTFKKLFHCETYSICLQFIDDYYATLEEYR